MQTILEEENSNANLPILCEDWLFLWKIPDDYEDIIPLEKRETLPLISKLHFPKGIFSYRVGFEKGNPNRVRDIFVLAQKDKQNLLWIYNEPPQNRFDYHLLVNNKLYQSYKSVPIPLDGFKEKNLSDLISDGLAQSKTYLHLYEAIKEFLDEYLSTALPFWAEKGSGTTHQLINMIDRNHFQIPLQTIKTIAQDSKKILKTISGESVIFIGEIPMFSEEKGILADGEIQIWTDINTGEIKKIVLKETDNWIHIISYQPLPQDLNIKEPHARIYTAPHRKRIEKKRLLGAR